MSGLSLTKHILYVSDDAVYLYSVSNTEVKMLHQEAYSGGKGVFEINLAEQLNRHVKDGTISILNDTVEQHYRREKVANLSTIDKKNIIKRKLSIAFPGYPIRAAHPIKNPKNKDKSEKTNEKIKDHLFLFVAIPTSEAYRKIVEAIRRSECSVSSIYILPIESSSLVDKLFDRLEKENAQQEKAQWRVLIGQHEGGGLRQIVVRNGQIALTRMTPVIPLQPDNAAQWASEVAQEFESTLSYLSRFGFAPSDGLDVAVIGSSDIVNLITDMISVQHNFYPLTIQRAADLAGIKLGKLNSSQLGMADYLHVAWLAKKTSKVLPLNGKELEELSMPRKGAFFIMLALLMGFAYGGFTMVTELTSQIKSSKNLELVKEMQVDAERIYLDEIKRKESLGIDIRLIQSSIDVYSKINKEFFDPLPILQIIGQELQDLKIDSIDIATEFGANGMTSASGTAPADAATSSSVIDSVAKPPVGIANIVMSFTFPGDTKPQDGNKQMEEFQKRLAQRLPKDKVEITKNLADLTFTGALQNTIGVEGSKKNDDYNAEIKIIKEIYDQNFGS